jgi:effector-binding domain-containing protein
MTIKLVKPINFLFYRTCTTASELEQYLPIGQKILKEAVANDLPVTGPVHWHYHNFHGNAKAPFDLEVAVPLGVPPSDYDGEFHIKRTQEFKCISSIHEGDWMAMPQTYQKLMEFAVANHLKIKGNNREIYINVDFADPSANVTEVQLGIE